MAEGEGRLYTVDEVAQVLGVHVKTVRGYVRAGKLPAARLGTRYRITASALAAFTGHPPEPPARESAARTRRVQTTSIVQVDAASPETLRRVEAMVGAAALAYDDEPLRVQTVYDEQRAELRVILLGAPQRVATALQLLAVVLEDA